jgi:hypothetical protein
MAEVPGCASTSKPAEVANPVGPPGGLFIDPGNPWQNAWIESFNGRLGDELLNSWRFDSLVEARVIIDDWRHDYNANRPHSAHGELTPNEFALQWTTTHPPQAHSDWTTKQVNPLRCPRRGQRIVRGVYPATRVRQPANSDTARWSRDPGYSESMLRVAGTAFVPSPQELEREDACGVAVVPGERQSPRAVQTGVFDAQGSRAVRAWPDVLALIT